MATQVQDPRTRGTHRYQDQRKIPTIKSHSKLLHRKPFPQTQQPPDHLHDSCTFESHGRPWVPLRQGGLAQPWRLLSPQKLDVHHCKPAFIRVVHVTQIKHLVAYRLPTHSCLPVIRTRFYLQAYIAPSHDLATWIWESLPVNFHAFIRPPHINMHGFSCIIPPLKPLNHLTIHSHKEILSSDSGLFGP